MLRTITKSIYERLLVNRTNVIDNTELAFPELRIETTAEQAFDIMDKKPVIIYAEGKGCATYHNPEGLVINVLDYECFVNSLAPVVQKGQRRPDFIVVDKNESKLIINELSTGNPKTKKSDALYQMNHLVQLLRKTSVWSKVEAVPEKECVFSCRQSFASTPQVASGKSLADSFGAIQELMSGIVELNFQPITKAGFRLYQSDHILF